MKPADVSSLRMLRRARDRIDRDYAEPIGIPVLAAGAGPRPSQAVSCSCGAPASRVHPGVRPPGPGNASLLEKHPGRACPYSRRMTHFGWPLARAGEAA